MSYRRRSFLATLAVAAIATTAQAQFAVSKLGPDHNPAATDFNARKGRTRLVTILSPT